MCFAIRGADDNAIRALQDGIQKYFRLGQVLNSFEADDEISFGIIEVTDIAAFELSVIISLCCVTNCFIGDIQAECTRSGAGRKACAVAFSARGIDYMSFFVPRLEKEVALPMIQLSGCIASVRHHSLSGPRELSR